MTSGSYKILNSTNADILVPSSFLRREYPHEVYSAYTAAGREFYFIVRQGTPYPRAAETGEKLLAYRNLPTGDALIISEYFLLP
jgi:hypothetical protein